MQSKNKFRGITCAGNWIVDHVKILDCLPGRGMLANIQSETSGTGGAPFNVLMDLGRLGANFPLAGIGVVGEDAGRDFVLRNCAEFNIDCTGIVALPDVATSYTDVMTEGSTGDRVFYHCRGANARFGPEHVPLESLSCRIFHLGYLLLLDALDAPDKEYGTVAARLLSQVQALGIKTSVDVVSEESDRFARIVPATLPYADYLILNEIEAGRTVGLTVRRDDGTFDGVALKASAEKLLSLGRMELVVIHMPEGAYLLTRSGQRLAHGSLRLPADYIKSAVGAGDAFCAGMLYAIHEGWDYADGMRLGTCAAAASLAHPGATGGMLPLKETLKLAERFGERPPPVDV
jgi:sugar/nucleoside kinase (ribokinase family)